MVQTVNSTDGVKALSRFVEWILSFYQDALNGMIDMLTSGETDGALSWLMKSWKSLFVLLIVAGLVLNIVIYFARWKPHWWWFAKRRPVVSDALLMTKKKNSVSDRRVKPSTIVPKRQTAISPQPDLFQDGADSLFGDAADQLMETHKNRSANK